jgi:hypothetical protein
MLRRHESRPFAPVEPDHGAESAFSVKQGGSRTPSQGAALLEGIVVTARELFVLALLVVVFVWLAYQLVRTSRQ